LIYYSCRISYRLGTGFEGNLRATPTFHRAGYWQTRGLGGAQELLAAGELRTLMATASANTEVILAANDPLNQPGAVEQLASASHQRDSLRMCSLMSMFSKTETRDPKRQLSACWSPYYRAGAAKKHLRTILAVWVEDSVAMLLGER